MIMKVGMLWELLTVGKKKKHLFSPPVNIEGLVHFKVIPARFSSLFPYISNHSI